MMDWKTFEIQVTPQRGAPFLVHVQARNTTHAQQIATGQYPGCRVAVRREVR